MCDKHVYGTSSYYELNKQMTMTSFLNDDIGGSKKIN